ncbi:MAG: hypothetical protein A2X56_09035 [Nitrospirae bacterium GWC2_57_13]|jgi:cytochrome c biogenesis protein CcmG, thiol:disulfide interchange protein DsbE|nr:MAG: hypothetical protein A2X56_09035 [Nitrospirae bacterium GWC2_57_13]OGW46358.1 MAG: hypothetical protein A2X57_05195 [Nitrospirae bacterium GWD2_57_8]
MKIRCPLIFPVLVVLVLLTGCKAGETQRAAVGSPAPAFALQGLDGRTARLADFRGKVVVMDFWATWCAPCKESTKEFEALHRKFKDRGVVMIGISMDKGTDASATVKKYAQENTVAYLMLMDDGRTSDAYAVRNIPATYILDRDHVLVKTYPGYLSGLGDRIAKEIEELLSKPERSES